MPQHYTKATVEASIWCNACNRETPWRIADGRRQYCLSCEDKAKEENKITERQAKVLEPIPTQMDLFR